MKECPPFHLLEQPGLLGQSLLRGPYDEAGVRQALPMPRPARIPPRFARTLGLLTAAWNTNDARERHRLVIAACSERIDASSPYGTRRGRGDQLAEISQVRIRFPRLTTKGKVLCSHGRFVLSAWRTEFGGTRPPLEGIDCYEFDGRGRIVRIVSFSPVKLGDGRSRPPPRPTRTQEAPILETHRRTRAPSGGRGPRGRVRRTIHGQD